MSVNINNDACVKSINNWTKKKKRTNIIHFGLFETIECHDRGWFKSMLLFGFACVFPVASHFDDVAKRNDIK